MAAKPVVRLVTPADPNDHNKSHDTLDDVLKRLLGSSISLKFYYGVYDPTRLAIAAQKAVDDAIAAVGGAPAQRAVIVAAGTMTTNILQGLRAAHTDITIIQAVGGALPDSPRTNITGFLINVQATALDHLTTRLIGCDPVAVLYDDTPGSLYNTVYASLYATGRTLRPLTARTPAALKTLTLPADANGFMLIPNAMFYNNRKDVVHIVDNKKKATDGTTPLPIYYPEREYKDEHGTKNGVVVRGHNVAATYSLAASYVDSLINGTLTTAPEFAEAVQDHD